MLNRPLSPRRAFGLGLLSGLLVVLALGLLWPRARRALAWRWDVWRTQLRMAWHPVGAVPTPRATPTPFRTTPSPTVLPARTPTPDHTLQPTALPTMTPSPTPLPPIVRLTPPRWEKQDWNNCGPATLALYLRWWGWTGDQYTIAEVVKPKREDRNVNVEELVHFVRTQAGWLRADFRVGGTLERLKQFLAAGMPIMIEEGMTIDAAYWYNDDLWAGHYLLLTGYDDARQVFLAQDSYHGPNREVAYTDLDSNWEAFNRVYIFIYSPEWEDTVQAILGPDLDPDRNRQRALEAARQATLANPNNAFAWFNLGTNLVYFERYNEAAQAYDRARQIGLPQRFLRYQFGPFIAYFHSGRIEDLLDLTDYALHITPNAEEALLWRGWARYRLGDLAGAVASFRKALQANPNYTDAQYALRFLGVSP